MATLGGPARKQKWEAGDAIALPNLLDIPGVKKVVDPVRFQLETVYFDTATLALSARRITLRRRSGGTDYGWRLKLPAGTVHRRELLAPLGRQDIVPEELLDRVLAYTRDAVVMPVARFDTRRTTYRLYGPGGGHLANFVDDRVEAESLQSHGTGTAWREWTIKLVHGDRNFFAGAAGTLISAGASPRHPGPELARALEDAYPPEFASGIGRPSKKGPILDVATAYLTGRLSDILIQDPGVRLGSPDAIYRMRLATRRTRTTLATYRSLFAKTDTRQLKGELKWLARILGRPRDAEVMRERLCRRFRDLPAALQNRTVTGPVEEELGTRYNAGYKAVLKTLETQRYYRLLDGLEHFLQYPPTTARASKPAPKATVKLVNKAAKQLDQAHRAAAHAKTGAPGDIALHQVRKDAKRLQYAAESVKGIHGTRARKLSRTTHRVQSILGDHQDSVVVRAFLESLIVNPATPEIAATAYRRIGRIEERAAHAAGQEYAKARKKASGLRLPP